MDDFYKKMSDCAINHVLRHEAEISVKCEKCGSDKITEISYGLPGWLTVDDERDPRIKELLNERLIVLGGCIISADSPKYFCRNCKTKFGVVEIHR